MGAGAGAAGLTGANPLGALGAIADDKALNPASTGRVTSTLKHSVTRWPYGKFTIDQLAQMARELGIHSV